MKTEPLGQPVAGQGCLRGSVIVHDEMDVLHGCFHGVEECTARHRPMAPLAGNDPLTAPGVQGRAKRGGATAQKSWVRRSTWPGPTGHKGLVRSRAWICDFASTHNTVAR